MIPRGIALLRAAEEWEAAVAARRLAETAEPPTAWSSIFRLLDAESRLRKAISDAKSMRDRPVFVRTSRIKRRWLRRAAIVATYPLMTLLGGLMLVWAVLGKIVDLQYTLIASSARVWRLPGGDVEDLINPLCAGGIRELARQRNGFCPKCGSVEGERCNG